MRKHRIMALILAAAMLAAMPMNAYARSSAPNGGTTTPGNPSGGGSSGGGGGGGGGGGSSAAGHSAYVPPTGSSGPNSTTVSVSASGAKTTGAASETEAGGTSFGIVVESTTSTGQAITVNSRGEAVIGNTAIGLAKDAAATAGLPSQVVASIQAINSGVGLNSIGLGVDLTGYAALTATHSVIVKDNATQQVKKGEPVEVTLYVSSLINGLDGISALFYDNETGMWKLIPAVRIDPVTKTVSFMIENSGTVCIVHK